MPAQMKRPAAAAAKSGGKAARKEPVNPTTQKCNAIVQIIESAKNYPDEVKNMLAGCVKRCLEVPKEDRHQVQNEVIKMIGELLASVEASHTEELAALEAKVAAADTEKESRSAAAAAASAAALEKAEAVQAAKEALLTAKADRATALTEVATSVQAQKAGDEEQEAAGEKKAMAESTVSGALAALKSGSTENAAKSVLEVMEVGRKLGLDAQLLASATVALGKGPDARSEFDGVVVAQVDGGFSAAIARLTDMITNGEASKAERVAKVDACKAKLEAAEKHVESCQQQREAAQVALKEAKDADSEAKKAVKSFGPEMDVAGKAAAAAKGPLASCKEVIVGFNYLVEGPPAEPEVVAVEGDAAAEPAAAGEAETATAA